MDTTTTDDMYDDVQDVDNPRLDDPEEERYTGPQFVVRDVWSGAHSDDLD